MRPALGETSNLLGPGQARGASGLRTKPLVQKLLCVPFAACPNQLLILVPLVSFLVIFIVWVAKPAWIPDTHEVMEPTSPTDWTPNFFDYDPQQLAIVLMCVACGVIPWALYAVIAAEEDAPSYTPKQAESTGLQPTWFDAACASLCEGLHVELERQPTVVELAQEATPEDLAARNDLHRDFPIGPNCEVTEGEIRAQYPDDEERADQAILLIKLGLGLLAFGHCTIDVETLLYRAAWQLGVPSPHVSIGHRQMQARFGSGPAHLLSCDRDFVFSALADLTSLATALAIGDIEDAKTALHVADVLFARPLPYGWLVFQLDFWFIGPWAAIGAYYGTYWDMLGALCISPAVLLTMKLWCA